MPDSLLKSLDVAPAELDVELQQRAEELVERIMSDQPVATAHRRWLLAVAAGLVLAVGVFAIQAIQQPTTAFATWTATPSPVTADDEQVAIDACRDLLARANPIRPRPYDVANLTLDLIERRGDWVYLTLQHRDPAAEGSCLLRIPIKTGQVVDRHLMGGCDNRCDDVRHPEWVGPRDFSTQGTLGMRTPPLVVTEGFVGSQVDRVTIDTGGQQIEATVHDGRYLAWWPGQFTQEALKAWSYKISYTDGTTTTDRTGGKRRPTATPSR